MFRSVVVLMLLSVSLSGCLADDIWREPFNWSDAEVIGENVDGAQAFAGALAGLGDRGTQQGDVVVRTADDLPDNIVFQNMRDFLNRQDPGRGDQVHDNITTATGTAAEQYVTLTGPASQALQNATAPLAGTAEPQVFTTADRTTRIRLAIDVVLIQEPPEQGSNPSPAGNIVMTLVDPRGAIRMQQTFDTSRHYEDMFVVGTYGGDNQVIEDLAGEWTLDVQASGEGAWSFAFESYEPEFDDYEWWQIWRGDRREVVGE